MKCRVKGHVLKLLSTVIAHFLVPYHAAASLGVHVSIWMCAG